MFRREARETEQNQQQHLAASAVEYTSRRFGGRRGNKVRYCCPARRFHRRLPACWEANPGAGVCNTEVIMAVNLDKEAYYRRIKRLYSNWKVKKTNKNVSDCPVCVNARAPISRRVEKVRRKRSRRKVSRLLSIPASWRLLLSAWKAVMFPEASSSAWKRETGLHPQFGPSPNRDTFTPWNCPRNVPPVRFYPPKYRAMLTHVSTSPR